MIILGIILSILFFSITIYFILSINKVEAGKIGVLFFWGKAVRILQPGPCIVLLWLYSMEEYDSTIFPLDWEETTILSGKDDDPEDDPLKRALELQIDLDVRMQIIDQMVIM